MVRRFLVFLAVACYCLAVTVGEAFHNHEPHGCAAHSGCAAADDGQHISSRERPVHADENTACQVCRFLAQKPIPARAVTEVHCAALVEEVAADRPIRRAFASPSTHPIRGPPHVA